MGEAAALLLSGECGWGGCEEGWWCGGCGEGRPPPGCIRCGESSSLWAGDTFADLAAAAAAAIAACSGGDIVRAAREAATAAAMWWWPEAAAAATACTCGEHSTSFRSSSMSRFNFALRFWNQVIT